MTRRPASLLAAALLAATLLLQAGCAGVPATADTQAVRLDATPRIAVISAFQPELPCCSPAWSSRASTWSTAWNSPPARYRASRCSSSSAASA